MVKSTKKVVTKKRRSNKRPSSFSVKNKRTTVVKFRYSIRHALQITARRFKTSKKAKQFVVWVPFSPVRELTFRRVSVSKIKKAKKQRKTYEITLRIQPLKILSYSLMVVGIAGSVFFAYQMRKDNPQVVDTNFYIPTPAPTTDFTKPKVLARSMPVELRIPAINLEVKSMQVGRLDDGTMETPPVLERVVGWYKYSPTPGELGPSVIAGHVDSYTGPSVFWRLHELKVGDGVEIKRADGSVAKFRVDAVQKFDQKAFPTNAVYGNIDHSGLRLITCGGIFNKVEGQYSHNTVVFASLVNGNKESS